MKLLKLLLIEINQVQSSLLKFFFWLSNNFHKKLFLTKLIKITKSELLDEQ